MTSFHNDLCCATPVRPSNQNTPSLARTVKQPSHLYNHGLLCQCVKNLSPDSKIAAFLPKENLITSCKCTPPPFRSSTPSESCTCYLPPFTEAFQNNWNCPCPSPRERKICKCLQTASSKLSFQYPSTGTSTPTANVFTLFNSPSRDFHRAVFHIPNTRFTVYGTYHSSSSSMSEQVSTTNISNPATLLIHEKCQATTRIMNKKLTINKQNANDGQDCKLSMEAASTDKSVTVVDKPSNNDNPNYKYVYLELKRQVKNMFTFIGKDKQAKELASKHKKQLNDITSTRSNSQFNENTGIPTVELVMSKNNKANAHMIIKIVVREKNSKEDFNEQQLTTRVASLEKQMDTLNLQKESNNTLHPIHGSPLSEENIGLYSEGLFLTPVKVGSCNVAVDQNANNWSKYQYDEENKNSINALEVTTKNKSHVAKQPLGCPTSVLHAGQDKTEKSKFEWETLVNFPRETEKYLNEEHVAQWPMLDKVDNRQGMLKSTKDYSNKASKVQMVVGNVTSNNTAHIGDREEFKTKSKYKDDSNNQLLEKESVKPPKFEVSCVNSLSQIENGNINCAFCPEMFNGTKNSTNTWPSITHKDNQQHKQYDTDSEDKKLMTEQIQYTPVKQKKSSKHDDKKSNISKDTLSDIREQLADIKQMWRKHMQLTGIDTNKYIRRESALLELQDIKDELMKMKEIWHNYLMNDSKEDRDIIKRNEAIEMPSQEKSEKEKDEESEIRNLIMLKENARAKEKGKSGSVHFSTVDDESIDDLFPNYRASGSEVSVDVHSLSLVNLVTSDDDLNADHFMPPSSWEINQLNHSKEKPSSSLTPEVIPHHSLEERGRSENQLKAKMSKIKRNTITYFHRLSSCNFFSNKKKPKPYEMEPHIFEIKQSSHKMPVTNHATGTNIQVYYNKAPQFQIFLDKDLITIKDPYHTMLNYKVKTPGNHMRNYLETKKGFWSKNIFQSSK